MQRLQSRPEPSAESGRGTQLVFDVEAASMTRYIGAMSQTLEQRVEGLERKLAELANRVDGGSSPKRDWHRTFGLSHGDDGFKEMVRLGREYRQSLGAKGDC